MLKRLAGFFKADQGIFERALTTLHQYKDSLMEQNVQSKCNIFVEKSDLKLQDVWPIVLEAVEKEEAQMGAAGAHSLGAAVRSLKLLLSLKPTNAMVMPPARVALGTRRGCDTKIYKNYR